MLSRIATIALVAVAAGEEAAAQVIDPGELTSGRYGFITYVGDADVASGYFELLETDQIKVSFDYPDQPAEIGAFISHEGQICFSGFDNRNFPDACGALTLHWATFPGDIRLWFASAEPGAFYPGDNGELIVKRDRRAKALRQHMR